ncbi:MAG: hypothetical protein WCA21_04720 [Terracidiphilus sp.]
MTNRHTTARVSMVPGVSGINFRPRLLVCVSLFFVPLIGCNSTQRSTGNADSQTITFGAISNQTVGTPLTLSATASSGLAVVFTSATQTICTVSGTTATLSAAGTCTIQATQPGNSAYSPAPMVPQSFTVNPLLQLQTINFPNPGNQTVGTRLTLSATASSGLAVVFTSATQTICTVSGTTATLSAAGTCTIQATQPGNSVYSPAPMVPQSFTVGSGKSYYVSNSGSDSNSGLSPIAPWKTLAKVSASKFNPGDRVLLQCGGIWRESLSISSSGSTGNDIVFSNYGTGSNPIILGSQQPTSWTNVGGNVWQSNAGFATNPYSLNGAGGGDVWTVNSDGTVNTGVYETSLAALTAQNDWYYAGDSIYLYSPSDPSTAYSSVEVSASPGVAINLNAQQNITINGIDMFYGNVGIYQSTYPASKNLSGLLIENCTIAYWGYPNGNGVGIYATYSNSVIQNNVIHDSGRRGVSLIIVSNTFSPSNITIQYNTFYHGYHTTSVDIQQSEGYTGGYDGIYINGNHIYDSCAYTNPFAYPMQMFISDQGVGNGAIKNVYATNNVFECPTGASMNIQGIGSLKIYNNTFSGTNSLYGGPSAFLWIATSTVDVKDNIFYSQLANDTNDVGLSYYLEYSDVSTITSDYNLFYRISPSLTIVHTFDPNYSFSMSSASSLTVDLGWEAHSIFADPDFVSASDFQLQASSPAIGTGTNDGVTTDILGNTRTGSPTMGAYTY